jgi:hypothetical protein
MCPQVCLPAYPLACKSLSDVCQIGGSRACDSSSHLYACLPSCLPARYPVLNYQFDSKVEDGEDVVTLESVGGK